MGRKPRSKQIMDGDTFHLTWQCHNKDFLLADNRIKQKYYELLLKYSHQYGVKIHAYSIMDSHPHLYGTLSSVSAFSKFQQVVNTILANKINIRLGRKGQVVRDRFTTVRAEKENQGIVTLIYIDINPVKAGLVSHPKDYLWSSFHYYASGKRDPLITPAPAFLQLGDDNLSRRKNYLELLDFWLEREKYIQEFKS